MELMSVILTIWCSASFKYCNGLPGEMGYIVPDLGPRDTKATEKYFKNYVDTSSDPCDNFESFTCKPFAGSSNRAKRASVTHSFTLEAAYYVFNETAAEIAESYRQIRSGKRWDGPKWLRKMILVHGADTDWTLLRCSALLTNRNKGYCQAKTLLEITFAKYVTKCLTLYGMLERNPNYRKNGDFVKGVVPLAKSELLNLFERSVSSAEENRLKRAIRFMRINIGYATDAFNRKMDESFKYLSVHRTDSKITIEGKYRSWILGWGCDKYKLINGALLLIHNAYSEGNTANYGGTLLVPPNFNQNLTYGAIFGSSLFVLCHEMGHVFQEQLDAIYVGGKFWGHIAGFDALTKCALRMFEKFKIRYKDGGASTLGAYARKTFKENFADFIGLHLSWSIYSKYYKAKDPEFIQVGNLKLNREQAFLISVGTLAPFCNPDSDKLLPGADEAIRYIKANGQLPGRYRLEMIRRVIPNRMKAFNCSSKASLVSRSMCIPE